jgi:hypothetical protein
MDIDTLEMLIAKMKKKKKKKKKKSDLLIKYLLN